MTTNPLTDPQIEGPDGEFLIEDLDTVRMLNDPVRNTILQLLIFEPKSVKDLAAELDVPVTRLYYHVNMLEDSGVIRVVATRKAGAMIQKLYQATARSYRPSPRIVDSIDDPKEAARIGVATVLDTARVDVEQAVAARFADPDGDHPPSGLGRTILRLSPAEAQRLLDELVALLESYEVISDDGGMWMSFSYAFAPSAGLPKGAVDGD